MNCLTIVAGEHQTELFYKTHGNMYSVELARQLYSEIADVEEEHVTQYGLLGDPRETMLEKSALMQLCEAYIYFSCADLIEKYEGRDIMNIVKADVIEPLVVFEPNKEYVNQVIEEQLDLTPHNMEYKRFRDIPDDWPSFRFQWKVNEAGVPSEEVVGKARSELAQRDQAENVRRFKYDLAQRTENVMTKKMRTPHPL